MGNFNIVVYTLYYGNVIECVHLNHILKLDNLQRIKDDMY